MISYFFNHFFHKRIRMLIILILVLTTTITFFMANPFTSKSELFLQMDHYNLEYHSRMLLIIKYILLFSISLILIDHDANFLKPLIAYFKRFKIASYKLVFYYGFVIWLITTIYAIIIVVPFIITPYYQIKIVDLLEFLKMVPDFILLATLLLILTRDNRKPISFLILILVIVFSFIQEDTKSLTLGYILPLSSSILFETTFGYYYLIIYFMALILVYFLVFEYENI